MQIMIGRQLDIYNYTLHKYKCPIHDDNTSFRLPTKRLDMDLGTNINNGMGSPQSSQRSTAVPITTGSPIPKVNKHSSTWKDLFHHIQPKQKRIGV